ncbi:MAG TPA: AraC family transcriptional regulator, partial [Saprospiraceae bacterium]|nr:AraC family transcriptional regulator [Saprospiraceae bacterium]
MESILAHHHENRQLTTLVENRTSYSAIDSELNIYETHSFAEAVHLTFNFPVIASMITGKKIMHLRDMPSFDFLPGESVVVPANETMAIDFPEATLDNPTQCLALGIDSTKIKQIAANFNQRVAIGSENNQWSMDNASAHLTNQVEVNHLLTRIVHTYTHNTSPLRDVILDLMLQELVVRLLQTKAKYSIISDPNKEFENTRIGTVIQHIKNNLTMKNISVSTLARIAHMSTSHFYKQFRNTLGISPIDF